MNWQGIPEEYRNAIVAGDARELAKRIPDESIDLIFTDPPYGIGFKYDSGYEDDKQGYIEVAKWIANESQRICKMDGYCFVYQAQARLRETWSVFPPSRIFVEAQNFHQVGRMDNPFRFGVDYGFTPIVFWRKTPGDSMVGTRDWIVANTANTSSASRTSKYHRAGRPLDSVLHIVSKFSRPGDIVVDFFAGSGTLAVACKILGRNYVAFEIDPDTAEIARDRVKSTQPPLFVLQPEQLSLME